MAAEAKLQTRGGGATHAIDSTGLARMSLAQIDAVFESLEPVPLGQLQGDLRGKVVGAPGVDWLPSPVRAALLRVVNELPVWRGKSFEGEFGSDAWLLPDHSLRFARYLVREDVASLAGEGPVTRLEYDVAANPRAVRLVVGEIRELGDGVLLARTQLRLGERVIKLVYFTLEA
ncbi:hypothetical protein PPSIR1_32235 [Plesiocystis pacifica SIR-1]|uniref:Uncharacterized protein n=1 Tax=Plesiocystis pacifica SIR-1 TaxID=391625 RepID=A6GII7_9BACT|nr:hypothetical protein [Plesiocystis pacifica]EDM74307.1 hypothetical protein PPSIR1_32235 [Plesiocystis pacifica SIR-1]